ncbi:hypothetical protein JIN84_05280 [Luteolibacter yonseiensis]|uniref:Uncharacterized protein n=1 Tax=Luteolibacter yonseiensis TaxID=1144680 RepID=A0A934VAM4_9BACT|nr:hypothetical protein [Luteolibacter yonseiensis]MBK1815016.1 hypothetical protein [Luteolibacter yonseiensis]
MHIFLQRADGELRQLGHVDVDEALELFRQQDWESEMSTEDRLISDGRSWFSTHMEWVHDGGSSLTISPSDRGSMIIYRSGRKYRLLGVIPTPAHEVFAVRDVPDDALKGILDCFYRADRGMEKLLRKSGLSTQIFG